MVNMIHLLSGPFLVCCGFPKEILYDIIDSVFHTGGSFCEIIVYKGVSSWETYNRPLQLLLSVKIAMLKSPKIARVNVLKFCTPNF